MLGEVGEDLGFIPKPLLLERLKMGGVKIKTSTKVTEIVDGGVIVETEGRKEELLGFDTIVIALGYTSSSELYSQLKSVVSEVHLVGDAKRPQKIMEALTEAVEVGTQI